MRFKPEEYDAIVYRLVNGNGTPEEPGSRNMLVPYYLMAAHAYEELDDPFLTDGCFDWICRELDKHWDSVEHFHKHLIDRDALVSTTGAYLRGKFPSRIVNATKALLFLYDSPSEVGPIKPLPVPTSLDDLLGTIETIKKEVSRVTGLDDLLGAPAKVDLGDLL